MRSFYCAWTSLRNPNDLGFSPWSKRLQTRCKKIEHDIAAKHFQKKIHVKNLKPPPNVIQWLGQFGGHVAEATTILKKRKRFEMFARLQFVFGSALGDSGRSPGLICRDNTWSKLGFSFFLRYTGFPFLQPTFSINTFGRGGFSPSNTFYRGEHWVNYKNSPSDLVNLWNPRPVGPFRLYLCHQFCLPTSFISFLPLD